MNLHTMINHSSQITLFHSITALFIKNSHRRSKITELSERERERFFVNICEIHYQSIIDPSAVCNLINYSSKWIFSRLFRGNNCTERERVENEIISSDKKRLFVVTNIGKKIDDLSSINASIDPSHDMLLTLNNHFYWLIILARTHTQRSQYVRILFRFYFSHSICQLM